MEFPETPCHGRSVFAFIFEVVIIRYDKVARDRGIVHMSTHVHKYHLFARDPGIVVLYSEAVTCSLVIGWSIVEP